MKKGQAERIARERAAILAVLDDGQVHTSREIKQITGLDDRTIENRLASLRGEVDYLGRSGSRENTRSFYRMAQKPGMLPPLSGAVSGFPETYLRWGGWAV